MAKRGTERHMTTRQVQWVDTEEHGVISNCKDWCSEELLSHKGSWAECRGPGAGNSSCMC